MKQSDVAVLIPSFEPDSVQLTKLSKDLFARGFFVLIVNDGSSAAFDNAFNSAAKFATVIGYPTNGGKGFALKYGFNYIKEKLPEISYIITADGDGQHAIEDIVRVSELLKKENRPVLGVRDFANKIPFRSRLGNDMSRFTQTVFNGRYLKDNQCGLRGFLRIDIDWLIKVKGKRYEYEMKVISYLQLKEVNFATCGIKTIYENNNSSSHFRPLVDTLRIQKVIFTKGLPRLCAFLIAVLLSFLFYQYCFKDIVIIDIELSTILSSIVTIITYSLFNYCIYRPFHPLKAFLRGLVAESLNIIGIYIGVEIFTRWLGLPIALTYFVSGIIMSIPNYYLIMSISLIYEAQN